MTTDIAPSKRQGRRRARPTVPAVAVLFLGSLRTRTSGALVPPTIASWRPLPHVHPLERRDFLAGGASLATVAAAGISKPANAAASESAPLPSPPPPGAVRSVASVDSHPVIPVWPTWAGGRVVPVSLGGRLHDPFLLLAHHRHWFDPRDPLREPFKAFGAALGLPYVDVEGFPLHPHRGFDILTYVLDGSDGFRHRDSLGGARTYRGGTAQWMRAGSGVLHEEMWETRSDRRTDVELFQIWVNLPAARKFDPPAVRYVGGGTDDPWIEDEFSPGAGPDGTRRGGGGTSVAVRDVGATLDRATKAASATGVQRRPPVGISHARIGPGAEWRVAAPHGRSAMLYVREGAAALPVDDGLVAAAATTSGGARQAPPSVVGALRTATFAPDGDLVVVRNAAEGEALDVLLLTAEPLREPVAMGGPIVMNTEAELEDAYRQLSDGTFLDRERALRQQAETARRAGWGA